jgi:hypothetical protein
VEAGESTLLMHSSTFLMTVSSSCVTVAKSPVSAAASKAWVASWHGQHVSSRSCNQRWRQARVRSSKRYK